MIDGSHALRHQCVFLLSFSHMTLRRSLFALIAVILFPAFPVHAATLMPGDLIKTSSFSDVYVYGADGKRYVFANEKTYMSWYTGYGSVQTIRASELAAIPIGGAVTYRPGSRMVKLTTDPKTYAVDKGGVLRWVQTEAAATQLYGSNWNTKIDDLPDAFFATYKIGAPIASATDFSPSAKLNEVTTISQDKGLTTPTTTPTTPSAPPSTTSTTPSTPTSTIALAVSKTTARAGDFETLSATASDASGILKIELFFDGQLIQSCASSACSGEVRIPVSGTKTTYEAKAVATTLNTSILITSVAIPITDGASSLVTLTLGRTAIRQYQAGEAIVDIDPSIAVIRTDIYVDNQSIKACASAIRQCRWSDILSGAIGTVYDVHGVVTDSLGRTYSTMHKTITIGTNDSPTVTIAVGKSMIYTGETVDVTVGASDDDGIVSIEIIKDGNIIKTCSSAAPCTLITGPWPSAVMLSFTGRAKDSLGLSSTSDAVTVSIQ